MCSIITIVSAMLILIGMAFDLYRLIWGGRTSTPINPKGK